MRRLASDVKKTGTENYVRRDPSRKQRGMLPADTNRLTNSWKDKKVKPTPGSASAQKRFSGCAALGTTQVGQRYSCGQGVRKSAPALLGRCPK